MITCSLHLQVAEFIVSCQRSEYMLDMGKTLGLVSVSQDMLVSVLIMRLRPHWSRTQDLLAKIVKCLEIFL